MFHKTAVYSPMCEKSCEPQFLFSGSVRQCLFSFLWIGAIFLLREVLGIIIPAATGAGIQSIYQMLWGISAALELTVFIVCFVKCSRRKNRSSINLMEMWGIILFILLPLLYVLRQYIGGGFERQLMELAGEAMANRIDLSADFVYYYFYTRLMIECVEVLIILLGIFVVGAFADNRALKLASFILMLAEGMLALAALQNPNSFIEWMGISTVMIVLCGTLGMLLCGIFLKAGRRRILRRMWS